jgi:hypothetical protein
VTVGGLIELPEMRLFTGGDDGERRKEGTSERDCLWKLHPRSIY